MEFPKWTRLNWFFHKIAEEALRDAFSKYARGRVVDIGCGEKPYGELLKPYVSQHVGIDHAGTLHNKANIDVFGTAYNIPVEDEYFDTALCIAVLEHLEEPDKAIKEAKRVLKNGGYAIYTAPQFVHLHEEPRDFFRYTTHGLRFLFENNGFEIIELRPLSGFWVTFGTEFVFYLYRFRTLGGGGRLNPLWWAIPLIGVILQWGCYQLNKVDSSKEFTWAYQVVAKK